ncbi:TIGR01777 family oxidoreductase [Acinetobacter sp. P8-3-8]|uniref:TIGR01777 family oxidoreductase n=1 Tax=Acinetobacter sp. P8-3-8 TaxID=1029823 RepID=UPI0002486CDF|nr:TIGR01777 family oxidoreductase [Acinetobacter sp. P8-3-8]
MTTVLVTGATGFIGSHLLEYLLKNDFHVIAYSRQQKNSSNTQLQWIQDFSEIEKLGIDYVVNLAGESIGEGRWSEKRKQQLIQSRVETTAKLYQYLNQFQMKPKCIVSTSAIGFYGIDPEENWSVECDEASPSQNIFMSELCQKWEAEALSHSDQNTKIMRLAVVFGKGGGILPQMLLPIKLNLIGKIGTGRQPMTWVHVDDVIQAILFLFKSDSSQQIYNVAAPDHISQLQFVQIASQVLKRKPLLFLPSFVMKMLMGEQSQLVLNGQFVQPKALLKQGFQFQYTELSNALKQIVSE